MVAAKGRISGLVVATIAALGCLLVPAAASASGPCAAPDAAGLVVCTYDGNAGTAPGSYTLAVPAGSPSISLEVFGAHGGTIDASLPAGLGAEVEAAFTVPLGGTTLTLTVAAAGSTAGTGGSGYHAGGASGLLSNNNFTEASGGGGSSAVAQGATLLAEAGGGGGAGSTGTDGGVNGGNAGAAGSAGEQGTGSTPGAGGLEATPTAAGGGGVGGTCNGQSGLAGTSAGGRGGGPATGGSNEGGPPGGGGGGGYFGGGGGGQGGWCPLVGLDDLSEGGGGGGGASYASPSATSATILDAGDAPQSGNGKVVVSYPMPIAMTSFAPGAGRVGKAVTLTGSGFTWAASVDIGGVGATFHVVSDTQIEASVPVEALTGPITVANGAGASATSSASFHVEPSITGFSPPSGAPGSSVTISGTAFTGATRVTFNGTAASFSVDSYTEITAVVPVNATSGPIGVKTPGGKAKTKTSFLVT